MNKEGFTLIELLAVIIILSILALVTTPVVINVLSSSREKAYTEQVRIIESAAEKWGIDNIKSLPNSGTCSVTVTELSSYFSTPVLNNPTTGEEMEGYVEISKSGNKYNYQYKETTSYGSCNPST